MNFRDRLLTAVMTLAFLIFAFAIRDTSPDAPIMALSSSAGFWLGYEVSARKDRDGDAR